ncbi:MAG: stage V sporulation protein AA [Lachnospiraceae bacterium]|nr:stage V sporulation protein AA [Lachnospiraceae bacterium]
MSEILYVQTDHNMKVTKEKVLLGEIAKLSCGDSDVLARNQVRPVLTLPQGKYGRYVCSASELIQKITREEEHVDVTHIGEPTFVITFEDPKEKNHIWSWTKTIVVGALTFVGTAFSIMTFHTDVDVPRLFGNIYEMVTGSQGSGFGILEISYSIGIGIGVIFYFNHFGKRKLTQDPTPMEVQMRLYEDDVDTTIIEKADRSNKGTQ